MSLEPPNVNDINDTMRLYDTLRSSSTSSSSSSDSSSESSFRYRNINDWRNTATRTVSRNEVYIEEMHEMLSHIRDMLDSHRGFDIRSIMMDNKIMEEQIINLQKQIKDLKEKNEDNRFWNIA